MDFNEPDLEDLIQSDLRSEMNKILNQSETDACSTVCGTNLSVQKISSPKLEDNEVPHIPCTELSTLQKGITLSVNSTSVEMPDCVTTEEKVFSKTNNTAQVNISKENQETHQAAFSGHFAVEKLPSCSTSDVAATANILNDKSEQNDLSNLAWLTSVDVQQALQKSELHLSGMQQNQFPMNFSHQSSMPDEASMLPTNPRFNNGQVGNPQAHMPGQPECRPAPRFTPIQPNPNTENHQRYLLQGRTGTGHRALLPMTEHMGAQGSYPYPPPPYNTQGGRFLPNGFPQHIRYHNQGQKVFPKPVYSYSCLIAMSLRASKTGCLPVSDIYNFMMDNFPYFKTAPDGWKNSVRHNLSLNKCFEKVEKPNGSQRKGCLWALNPAKVSKMEEEVQKWKRKDPDAIRKSMSNPEELDRELEEIRRSDEEAARRRMLSMNSHGLSMITSPLGYHPYQRHHRHHNSPSHAHQQMHPSGSASLPTTPQHYHQHRPPFRQAITPSHRMSSATGGYPGFTRDHNHTRQPRQLFNYPIDSHGYTIGAAGMSSTPNSSVQDADMQEAAAAPQMSASSLSSPYSSTSSSSGNASFFGSLADTITTSGHDLNDIDLDSSLADLSAFQGPLWDDTGSALIQEELISEAPLEAFEDAGGQSHPQIDPSSAINTMEHSTSTNPPTNSEVFRATNRFGGDIPYFSSNNKAVMLH